MAAGASAVVGADGGFWTTMRGSAGRGGGGAVSGLMGLALALGGTGFTGGFLAASEIGRASCRERV